FFLQAEDGIRGGHVTGVQTCALPIFASRSRLDHLKGDREPGWWRGSSVFGSSEAVGDDWRTRLHMTDQGGMSRRFGPLSGSFGQIGRASCRGRVEVAGGAVGV